MRSETARRVGTSLRRVRALALGLAWAASLPFPTHRAAAQSPGQSSPLSAAPGPNQNPNPNVGTGTPGYLSGVFGQSNLLGDMFGLRSSLASKGMTYGINETSEVFGNVTGGVHQGADYDGLTTLSFGLDTARAFGWVGGTFDASAFEIHGRSVSADNLYTIQTASGIEASDTFRLWELWYDQTTRDGLTDLKIGQQSLDQEFMTSTYSTLFINTMMGWPSLPSYDMYAGGPAYPLSSLGVRLRSAAGPVIGEIGVFDDNPPGGPFDDDSQLRGAERSGTAFNLGTGALVIAELQYVVGQPHGGQDVAPGETPGPLPGAYRLGAWYDSGFFPDQRFGTDGLSLADPASDGTAAMRKNNFSIYFSGDQEVWIDAASVRSVGLFARVMGAPDDRNFVQFSADAGLSLKAPFTRRANDTFGLGYGITKVSSAASELDQDRRFLGGDAAYPIRSSESFIELTYQAQLAPWWQLQPDAQYVFMPGAGIPNPLNPNGASTPRIANELTLGIRTNITF